VHLDGPGAFWDRDPSADRQVDIPLLEDPAILGERGDDDPSRPTAPAERHRFCCSSACRAMAAIEHGHRTGRIDEHAAQSPLAVVRWRASTRPGPPN
jgi:hypothetical protein